MKKLLSALLVSTMILSFASCGSDESSSKKKKSSSSSKVTEEETTKETEEEETTEAEEQKTTSEEETTAEEETTQEATEEETTEEKTTEEEGTTEEETTKAPDKDKNPDINDYVKTDAPKPALWKASDPETGNEIYLMGTIHAVCTDSYSMPDYVTEVYDSCDKIAFEIDPGSLSDMESMQELLSYMVYTDGTSISDHISEEAYEAGKKALTELSMYNSLLDYYMPGFWINQIETSPLLKIENLSTSGVDARFAEMAKEDGKEILSIENLEIQANAMVGYSDKYASYCLETMAEDPVTVEEYAEQFAELYDKWAVGDIDAIAEEEDEDIDEIPEDCLDDYNAYKDIMIYDRNKGMAEKAAEYIDDGGDVFFMVGALHFAGEKGVTSLLEEKGYTVERLH